VVLEDGQPQPIVQFEAYATVPVAAPAEPVAAAQVGTPEAPKPQPTSAPRRYVVLVVDDLHIEASNLLRMKKTVDRFLEREIGPEDQVALVTTSGTGGLSQEFTSDRQALRRSVARVSIQDRTFVAIRAPYITEYQAELIERGDGEALRIAAQEIRDERQSPDAESEARGVARMVLDDSLHHARLTLETLDSVVRSLSELKARKIVVLVTDGFVAGLTISASGAYDIRRVTDACTRAGVIIYSLNTRGLVATLPGRSASSRMPSRDNTFNARDMMSRASEHATKDAMNALAVDTGGLMIENTNDLKRRYSGVTVSGRYRINGRSDIGGSYTLSRLWGNFDGENTASGPLTTDLFQYPEYRQASWFAPEGDLAADQRHRASFWLNYGIPKIEGLTISVLQDWATGVPYGAGGGLASGQSGFSASAFVDARPYVTDVGYATPQGGVRETYYYTARDAFRTEASRRTDMAANYTYRVPGNLSLDAFLQVQVLNVFNVQDLCACGSDVFNNGGGVALSRIGSGVLTPVSTASLAPFNPFTTTPVQGVNWNYNTNWGTPLNRFAFTSPRTFRMTFGLRF
jgi:VWFA-related protein